MEIAAQISFKIIKLSRTSLFKL